MKAYSKEIISTIVDERCRDLITITAYSKEIISTIVDSGREL